MAVILLTVISLLQKSSSRKKHHTSPTLQFDHIEQNDDLICYHYKVSECFDNVIIYPCDNIGCGDTEELFNIISNAIDIQPHIDVTINDDSVGIKIQKTPDISSHSVYFCVDDFKREPLSDGSYCIQSKHKDHDKDKRNKEKRKKKAKKKNGHKKDEMSCHGGIIVPDICTISMSEPTSQPTILPTDPLPPEFGGIIQPGQNISFSGGTFTVSNKLIIIRPDMIYSCSTKHRFVSIYEDQMDTQNLVIGNPIVSLLIDIREMPIECPVVAGIVNNITTITANIIEISLGDMDFTKLFLHADFEIINATSYEIPVFDGETFGDETVDDIIDKFGIPNNLTNGVTPIILEDNTTIINDTSILDPLIISNRRRLWGIRASLSIEGGIMIEFSPKPQLKVEYGFKVGVKVSVSLRMSWFTVEKFRFVTATTVHFGATAKIELKVAGNFLTWEIRPARFAMRNIIPFAGILPLLVKTFHKLSYGIEIDFPISAECSLTYTSTSLSGFEYKPATGRIPISDSKIKKKSGCSTKSFQDSCKVSAWQFLIPEVGISIYEGLMSLSVPIKIGPKVTLEIPAPDVCDCPELSVTKELVISAQLQLSVGALPWAEDAPLYTVVFGKIEVIIPLTPIFCLDVTVLFPEALKPLKDDIIELCCKPSNAPTTALLPSNAPSTSPTDTPISSAPTSNSTKDPTSDPTKDPTSDPTSDPTFDPTTDPTYPTTETTFNHTMEPTMKPTTDPTTTPTMEPTLEPTMEPTLEPTMEPIFRNPKHGLMYIGNNLDEYRFKKWVSFNSLTFCAFILIAIMCCIIIGFLKWCANKTTHYKLSKYDSQSDEDSDDDKILLIKQ